MEDAIEMFLQERDQSFLPRCHSNTKATSVVGTALVASYGLWMMFVLPGLHRVPMRLKVPYLPSSAQQTRNVLKLLEGRDGRLADLGSGDGRLVFAACSAGLQCTGFEINSLLLAFCRGKARWKGLVPSQAEFVNKDFWKSDLSQYHNVTAFLAPGVMQELEEKLLRELPDGARVIACRFPCPSWTCSCTHGQGLDQVYAYDMGRVRQHLQ